MVTVYFETTRPGYAEIVAKFDNEETYDKCFPALKKLCKRDGFDIITESVTEEKFSDDYQSIKRLKVDEDIVDDRIFSADDMYRFAYSVAKAALMDKPVDKKTIEGESIEEYISTRVAFEEGDGSFESYVMPKKSSDE